MFAHSGYSVGAAAYRNGGTRNPFVSGELRAAGERGDVPGLPGWGGAYRAVGRVEALPDVFLQGALKYTIHPYKN